MPIAWSGAHRAIRQPLAEWGYAARRPAPGQRWGQEAIMPQFLKFIFEGALGGIGFALGTALLGILLVGLHVALPYLIPVTVIVIAVWVKPKLAKSKVEVLPPQKSD